jgi:hypothetical protein
MVAAAIAFGRSWFDRFLGVQGLDRAMALAAQAFSALIPLIIVYSAVVPHEQGQDFASELIDRFDLSGSAADTVRTAFAAIGMSALSVTSVIWFPRSITASADQFGAMGVAFALLSWLFAAGCVLVVTATGGAVINEQLDAHRMRKASRA